MKALACGGEDGPHISLRVCKYQHGEMLPQNKPLPGSSLCPPLAWLQPHSQCHTVPSQDDVFFPTSHPPELSSILSMAQGLLEGVMEMQLPTA